jgi:hypothetical protein
MNLPILDVAIGVVFVYLLLSLICTTINEWLASKGNARARFLDKGITRLLGGDAAFKTLIYKHPMILSLVESDDAICPSYIPADKFATALFDLLSGKDKPLSDFAALRAGVNSLPNEHLKTAITAILDKSGDNAETARKYVENWYDENMDRVSGWYKRNAQKTAFIVGCVLTVVLNADTLHIASVLWTTPTLRAAIVEQAKVRSQKDRPEELLPMVEYADPTKPTTSQAVKVRGPILSEQESDLLSQVIGWQPDWNAVTGWLARPDKSEAPFPWKGFLQHLLGWPLTAIAISLGAPFWFDTLNRFMNIRNAGRSPDEPRDKSQPVPQKS